MQAKFLDDNNKELKQQLRLRQQEWKKATGLLNKTTTLHVHHIILYIISQGEHNTKIFFFWTKTWSFRIQLLKILQHLTNYMKLNKIDEVWNIVNSLFKWIFGLSFRIFVYHGNETWKLLSIKNSEQTL